MPTDEEKLDEIERQLKQSQARSKALKERTDALEQETNPPAPDIDHAKDGGVI